MKTLRRIQLSLVILLGGVGLLLGQAQAAQVDNNYPKLASHFIKWEILDKEVAELARFDLLTLDMEVQTNSPEQIAKIRQLNPQIIILAYLNSVEIIDDIHNYRGAEMRNALARGLSDSWWLRDSQGNKISNWPFTSMLNLTDYAAANAQGQRFNDYLADFVINNIKASGLWDGIFFDNAWGDVAWVNGGNIDANNDGRADEINALNQAWQAGFMKTLSKTRELAGPEFIIVGNGTVYQGYQKIINGMMFEGFPAPWESGGTWTGSMKTYLGLEQSNLHPQTSIINSYSGNYNDYAFFRFTFGSALMGNGFYTFNYGTEDYSHSNWYDEYGFFLGTPQSGPYNLLEGKSAELKPGLWRRDFQSGSVIINSTNQDQIYVFSKEEVEKIRGTQDPKVNDGSKITYIKLAPQDGIFIRSQSASVNNTPFVNGYFYRVFNPQGEQTRNGFFSYLNSFPGEAEVAILNNLSGQSELAVSAGFGEIKVQSNGQTLASFYPFSKNYRDRINIALLNKAGNLDQIIAGPYRGGPQVTINSASGKLLGSFFAYDKNLRTGVSVAVGDLDGDGQAEIITGPGAGAEPLIKIFTLGGVLKHSFLAYDKNFKGGVNVAVADVNGNGQLEIITGPGAGGGPHVRVFTAQGQVVSQFFAFDHNYRGGVRVGVSEANARGQADILVGIRDFLF